MTRRRRRLLATRMLCGAEPRWSWSLNGTSEYLRSAGAQTLGIADAWTLVLSASTLTTALTFKNLFELRGGDDANRILMRWEGANGHFNVLLWDSVGSAYTNVRYAILSAGVGAHLVVTYDGAASGDPVTLYLNGSPVAPAGGVVGTGTQADTARAVAIGASTAGSGFWDGLVQDVGLISGAADQSAVDEIVARRNLMQPLAGLAVHAWTPRDPGDMGQDYGSGPGIDVMAGAVGITAAEDRVPGLLVP